MFSQDNVTPHTAKVTKKLLEQFRWEVLSHPPQSPDLAPSDFHLFLHLKNHLAGKIFSDNDEVIKEVANWFNSQAAAFYDVGIGNLVSTCDKCINKFGDYVEK